MFIPLTIRKQIFWMYYRLMDTNATTDNQQNDSGGGKKKSSKEEKQSSGGVTNNGTTIHPSNEKTMEYQVNNLVVSNSVEA